MITVFSEQFFFKIVGICKEFTKGDLDAGGRFGSFTKVTYLFFMQGKFCTLQGNFPQLQNNLLYSIH